MLQFHKPGHLGGLPVLDDQHGVVVLGQRLVVVRVTQPDAPVLGPLQHRVAVQMLVAAVGQAVEQQIAVGRVESAAEGHFVEGPQLRKLARSAIGLVVARLQRPGPRAQQIVGLFRGGGAVILPVAGRIRQLRLPVKRPLIAPVSVVPFGGAQHRHFGEPALPLAGVAVGDLVAQVVHGQERIVGQAPHGPVGEDGQVALHLRIADIVQVGQPLVAVAVFVRLGRSGQVLEATVTDLQPLLRLDSVVIPPEVLAAAEGAQRGEGPVIGDHLAGSGRIGGAGAFGQTSVSDVLKQDPHDVQPVGVGQHRAFLDGIPRRDDPLRHEVRIHAPRPAEGVRPGQVMLVGPPRQPHEELRVLGPAGQGVLLAAIGHRRKQSGVRAIGQRAVGARLLSGQPRSVQLLGEQVAPPLLGVLAEFDLADPIERQVSPWLQPFGAGGNGCLRPGEVRGAQDKHPLLGPPRVADRPQFVASGAGKDAVGEHHHVRVREKHGAAVGDVAQQDARRLAQIVIGHLIGLLDRQLRPAGALDRRRQLSGHRQPRFVGRGHDDRHRLAPLHQRRLRIQLVGLLRIREGLLGAVAHPQVVQIQVVGRPGAGGTGVELPAHHR